MKDKEDTNENMRDREKGMINLNFAGIRSREELYRNPGEKILITFTQCLRKLPGKYIL